MAISLRAAGTATAANVAVTAVNPAVPTGTTTGDLSVLTVWMKPFGTTITTPTNWTKIGEYSNGTTAAGTDTGSTKVAVFVRESAPTGAIGALTLGGSPNSVGAVINSYQKTAGYTWDYSAWTSGGDAANGTNYSATGAAGIDVAAGDWVFQGTAVNGDVGTQSAQTIAGMSGATLGTYVVRQSADTTTGTDSHGEIGDRPVTAGSSTAAPTFTYTNASSGSGSTIWLRLREVAPPAPVASFTASTTTVTQGGSVTFTDTSTNTPTSWSWNFGTGASPATASTQGPHVVTYNTPGTSTVTLTATNDGGSDASDPTNITVNAVPAPVASFSSSTTTVTQGGTVTFTDTSTNTPTSWSWNFGTGASPATASTQGPHTVTFNTVGTSTVNLTATNAGGSDAADPTNITVEAPTALQAEIWNGASWVTASGGGAAAPTYISAESGFTAASQTTITVPRPAAAQTGDIVVVQVISSGATAVITSPTDFTDIIGHTINLDYSYIISYRVIGASDPASWDWTIAATVYSTYVTTTLRGQSGTPIQDFDVQNANSTQVTPSVTTTSPCTLLTFAGTDLSAAYSWTIDQGTERIDETVGTEFLSHALYTEDVSAGTFSRTVTGSVIQDIHAATIAVAGTSGAGNGVEIWNGTSWRTDCEIWNGTSWVLL